MCSVGRSLLARGRRSAGPAALGGRSAGPAAWGGARWPAGVPARCRIGCGPVLGRRACCRSLPLRRGLPLHPSPPPPVDPPSPRLSTPLSSRDGKWLVWGRAGAGIPCVCHLSVGCRVRYSCRPSALRPATGTAPVSRHRRPSAPRPGLGTAPRLRNERWQMAGIWSSRGRHTVRLPSLDGVPGPDSCWPPTPPPPLGTAAPRHRRPSAPRPPLSTAPAPQHRPPPQHREMANGWDLVEMGAAYRAFAVSRRGNPAGPG